MTSLLTSTTNAAPELRAFGTDGVRGRFGEFPVDAAGFFALGSAFGQLLRGRSRTPRAVVGRDTRGSSESLEAAFVEGAVSIGCNVTLIGIAPSSAVSYLTTLVASDGGAIITASHNPSADNGLKLFEADGSKFTEAHERSVESRAFGETIRRNGHRRAGMLVSDPSLIDRYVGFLRSRAPATSRLGGTKLVVDCANGAASHIASRVFEPLGIDIVAMEDSPTGSNINEDCGAVHPEAMAERVRTSGATLGLALDGDADRSVFADTSGPIILGDQALYALALAARRSRLPSSDKVVGTVLSNRGLEKALAAEGIRLVRTPVGDRHILAEMRATGAAIGGEASGHYLFRDGLPVSDGMYTCLELLGEVARTQGGAFPRFEPSHQVALNLRLARPLSDAQLAACERVAALVAAELGSSGRIVVRPSGTEPLLRITVDADEQDLVEHAAVALGKSLSEVVEDRASVTRLA